MCKIWILCKASVCQVTGFPCFLKNWDITYLKQRKIRLDLKNVSTGILGKYTYQSNLKNVCSSALGYILLLLAVAVGSKRGLWSGIHILNIVSPRERHLPPDWIFFLLQHQTKLVSQGNLWLLDLLASPQDERCVSKKPLRAGPIFQILKITNIFFSLFCNRYHKTKQNKEREEKEIKENETPNN